MAFTLMSALIITHRPIQDKRKHILTASQDRRRILQVLAVLRLELFRSLLLQKIEFFDMHAPSELTALISSELDSVRSFVFSNVARDRGA